MATEIGIIKTLIGAAVATATDGSQRTLQVGDRVYQDEVISTGSAGAVEVEFTDGSVMTLGRSSQAILDLDVFNPADVAQGPEDVDSDVEALQQALLDGVDPSQVAEATAAGAGTQGGNEGAEFVQVIYEAPEVTPENGFDTTGINVVFDETIEEDEIFDDVPTAGITTLLLDEDDLGEDSFDSKEQYIAFNELRNEFVDSTGFNADRSYAQGNDDVVDEFGDEIPGDDLPQDALTILTGTLNADYGDNGPGDIVFNAAGTQPAGLTSGGENIQYWVSDDGHSLVGYVVRENDFGPVRLQGEGSPSLEYAEIIFTAEITDPSTGEFRAALYGPVDHPDTTTEDNLFINLGFTISDFDGDTAQGTLRFDVDDDSPIIENMGEDFDDEFPNDNIISFDAKSGEDSDYVTEGLQVIHDESRNAQRDADDLFTEVFPFLKGGPLDIDMFGVAARPVESGFFNGKGGQYEGKGSPDYYEAGIRYDAGADGLKNLALTDAEGELLAGQDSGLRTSDTGSSIYLYTIPVELLVEISGGTIPEQFANMADNFVVGLTVPELDLTDLESLMERYESPEEIIADLAFIVGLIEDVGPSYGPFDADSHDDVIALIQLRAIDHQNAEDHDDMASISDLIHITITDNDGDTATSEAITISFDDDGPRIRSHDDNIGRVDEEGLEGGNPGDSYDDGGDAKGANTVTSESLNIVWGADNDNDPTTGGDRSVAFDEQSAPEGLTSNGDEVQYHISEDGLTLTAYTGTHPSDVVSEAKGEDAELENYNEVFVVTLSDLQKGSYTFELLDNLDHLEVVVPGEPELRVFEDEQVKGPEGKGGPSPEGTENDIDLVFDFTATDADSDTVSGQFEVIVDDDAPVIGDGEGSPAPEDSIVDEEGLATAATQDDAYPGDVAGFATTASGDLNISWGADDNNDNSGDADRSVAFDVSQPGLEGLKSNGEDVVFDLNGDGTILTATADGKTVFTVSLSDLEGGGYRFSLSDNLDHPTEDTEDDINLTFNFTATDSDGDSASSSFTVTVDDDAPVIGEALSEDDGNSILLGMKDGSAGLDDWGVTPSALTGAVTMNGVTANISFQDNDSDANSKLRIYNNNANHIGGGSLADNDGQGINNGETLTITFDTLMQQAEIGVDGLGNHFLPESSQQAHATWVAYKNGVEVGSGEIDNPEGQNEGLEGLLEVFTVSISGGFDTIVFGNNSNTVDSNYEVRYIQAQKLNIVDEEGLPEGNLGDSYSDNGDVAGAALTTSADLNIIWGADDNNDGGEADRSVTFDADQSGLVGLTSNDIPVTFELSEGGTVLTATAGDNTVFTVSLSDLESGSFDFSLLDNLDHPTAGTEDDLELSFAFTATDSDGDSVNGSFAVTVDDDAATVGSNAKVRLDDDALPSGNAGGRGDNTDAQNVTGTLSHSYGADGEGTVLLSGSGAPAGFVYEVNKEGALLEIKQDGETVIEVSLTDTTSGAYAVKQILPIAHADDAANKENNVEFRVNYQVTDGDGDTKNGNIRINVDDDTPTVEATDPTEVVYELTITNHDEVSSAGYQSSYGYYIKDADGNPTEGLVIWDNVQDAGNESATVTITGYTPDQIGYFIIPNGDDLNLRLTNDTEVTFEFVDGQWQAFDGLRPLTGEGSNVIFDVESLNKDEQDHVVDNDLIGNQNWEDLQIPSGDGDFNDVNVNVEWTFKSATGDINVDFGADGPGTVDFSDDVTVLDSEGAEIVGLFSDGIEIEFSSEDINDDGNLDLVGRAGDEEVLTITSLVGDDNDNYLVELLGPIDSEESDITIQAEGTVTDSDGDIAGTVSPSFNIDVNIILNPEVTPDAS